MGSKNRMPGPYLELRVLKSVYTAQAEGFSAPASTRASVALSISRVIRIISQRFSSTAKRGPAVSCQLPAFGMPARGYFLLVVTEKSLGLGRLIGSRRKSLCT